MRKNDTCFDTEIFINDLPDEITFEHLKDLLGRNDCIAIKLTIPVKHIFDTESGKITNEVYVSKGDTIKRLNWKYLAYIKDEEVYKKCKISDSSHQY